MSARIGETHHNAKLTDAQVGEIRALGQAYRKARAAGGPAALARRFGVHPMTITSIVSGGSRIKRRA